MTAKEKIFQSIEEKKEQYIQAADHNWQKSWKKKDLQ